MFSTVNYLASTALGFIDRTFLTVGASCSSGSFLGMPPWHKYLDGIVEGKECIPQIEALSDVWLIVLAIIEILLRLGSMAAIVYVLYGSVRFITARGNPDKINSARTAIQDAIIGLFISIVAIAGVNYIGSTFK